MLESHQGGWFYFQPLIILLILGFVINDNFQRGLVHFGFGLLWELRKWVGLLPVPLFVLRQVCDLLHKTLNLLLRNLCHIIIVIAVSATVSIFIKFQVTIPLVYLIHTMVRIRMFILDFESNSYAHVISMKKVKVQRKSKTKLRATYCVWHPQQIWTTSPEYHRWSSICIWREWEREKKKI